MSNKSVLIALDDLTEFYAIKNDIDNLQKIANVDIIVVENYSRAMYSTTIDTIVSMGYDVKPLSEVKNIKYKTLLEPYPIAADIHTEFRIRYEYGVSPASLKPNHVYAPEWNEPYDAVICYSAIGSEILSAYTKPCIIKPLQFGDFKLHKMGKKINLLVLFTWGDVSAAYKLRNIKEQLGDRYNLIIKAHHAVEYNPIHSKDKVVLKSVADEYHDASANVNELLKRADIVLSDNSSAIFTAIYLGIPTAIFSEATSDYHNMNGIKAAHFSLLIEPRRIPYTNKVEDVKGVIELALKNAKAQNKLKDELYPFDIDKTLVNVVEGYLGISREEEPYYIIKDLLREKQNKTKQNLLDQEKVISDLENKNEELHSQLESFLGVKRSMKLLVGNIKRRVNKINKIIIVRTETRQ